MANPNIVSVTSIYGKSIGAALTTANTDILTNSAASGKIFKVNTALISNIDGTNTATADIIFYDSSATTNYYIGYVISVPAASTLKVITKDSFIYLEEGDKIISKASANSRLQIVISYEDIS